ncbi:MAG TPA: ferredoxin, partial [Candidatus Hydrogenedentes bacterium]|nr:ferredoxin [Candidatus Hydrogenedentota bacterium]
IPNASSCRSPMAMLSALLKHYYAEKEGIAPQDLFVVAVMPCVAKKFEAARPEFRMDDGTPETDAVITTRELIWMIKCYGIDLINLPKDLFDNPFGESSGAADIFGTTGGVMEAALRSAVERLTGAPPEALEFTEVRAVEGLRERELRVGDLALNIGVANGLTNAKRLLDKVVNGEKEFHLIEVMACPGGCIGGGGQPYPPQGYRFLDRRLLAARAKALYAIDSGKELRSSIRNPQIQTLYKDYLGEPGGEKAHKLLHTHYAPRLPRGIR